MSRSPRSTDTARGTERTDADPVRYPSNHVVAIVDTPDQARAAWTALTHSGFLRSEVTVAYGEAAADKMSASTGRTGLADMAIRLAAAFGVANDEMATKDRYEEALRNGQLVIGVLAPTEERKELAGQVLRENGGEFVHFLGRFAIEPLRK